MQNHDKHNYILYILHNMFILKDYTYSLESRKIKKGNSYSVRGDNYEISIVKQKKLYSKTFDDKICYLDKIKSLTRGHTPSN